MKKVIRKIDLFFLFLLFGLSLVFSLKFISSDFGVDERIFIWTGYNILHGEIPYRDFLILKPIMIFFTNTLGLLIFGVGNCKIFPLLIVITSIISLYLSLKKLGVKDILSFLLTLHYVFIIFYSGFHITLNDTETYGLSFVIIGLSLLFWNYQNEKVKKYDLTKFFAGMFFVFSIMSKEPFIFAVFSILIPAFLFAKSRRQKYYLTHFTFLFIGGVITVTSISLYLHFNHALIDYINLEKSLFVYAKTYSSQPDTLSYALFKLNQDYYNPKILSMLIPFFLLFFLKYKINYFSTLAIVGVIFGAYGISIGHNYWNHNNLIGTASLLVPAIFGALYLSQTYQEFFHIRKFITIIIFIIFYTYPLYLITSGVVNDIKTKYIKPNIYPDKKITNLINRYSSKGDYILLKDDPFPYVLWDRKHSLKRSVMIDRLIVLYEGNTEEEKLTNIKIQIESKLPKIIYIPPSVISSQQTKHLDYIVNPLIREHKYTQIYPDLFVLDEK
jgi:hypothetical protein